MVRCAPLPFLADNPRAHPQPPLGVIHGDINF